MSMLRILVPGIVVVLAIVVAAGCGGRDSGEPSLCGGLRCGDRQVCDSGGAAPTCVCGEAYAGASCDECAPGYEPDGDRCVAVMVDCADDPCVGGECMSGIVDRCVCAAEYQGPTCAQCAAGYQDNDGDGTCNPDCATAAATLACEDGLVCRDDGGTPTCACPRGMAGDGCTHCEAGYYRLGDQPCVPSCGALGSCGENSHCLDDGATGASCVCDVGYQGAGCGACESGFVEAEGGCVAEVPTGRLLTYGEARGQPALMRLDPATGDLVAVRTLPAGWIGDYSAPGLTVDAAGDRVYVTFEVAIEGGIAYALGELDLSTGDIAEVSTEFGGSNLAYVPMQNAIYMAGSWTETRRLVLGDPPRVETLSPTGLYEGGGTSVLGLAWDSVNSRLLGHASNHMGPAGLFAVDLATGVFTHLAATDVNALDPAPSDLRHLAVTAGGSIYALGTRSASPELLSEQQCREFAHRLGYADAATAPYSGATSFPSGTATMASARASGSEIIGITGYGGGPTELVIDSRNPDAFVCVITFEANVTLRFAANATFAAGLLHSYRMNARVEVDPAFVKPTTPNFALHITKATPDADLSSYEDYDPSFAAHADLFRTYTQVEWRERRIPEIESFSTVDALIPSTVLLSIDASGVVTEAAALDQDVHALAAY